MFEIVGLIFGVLVFCPLWDKLCDCIYKGDQ
jgi:hypothetical protein